MNLDRLVSRMQAAETDTLIISDPHLMQYFINVSFHTGERLAVLMVTQKEKPKLILNRLFPCKPIAEADLIWIDDTHHAVQVVSDHIVGKTVGIDKVWPSGFLLDLMVIRPDVKFVNGSLIADEIKAIKDTAEQEKMRKASLLNDEVMKQVRTILQPGISEKEAAAKINEAFRHISKGEPSFDTIVAFGPNGADPHCVPGSKRLEKGDSIIIDMGCRFEGYCSDMTRTFFWEENTMTDIYDAVLRANLAGIAAVRPGVRFSDIDRAARSVIEAAGYGQYFTHRTGHGIGLGVHEPYDVSASNDMTVKPGMCFSIEPGIYIEGKGGVRIEDLVLVTEDGCEILNHDDKLNPVLS